MQLWLCYMLTDLGFSDAVPVGANTSTSAAIFKDSVRQTILPTPVTDQGIVLILIGERAQGGELIPNGRGSEGKSKPCPSGLLELCMESTSIQEQLS